jgi:hypothetical protein
LADIRRRDGFGFTWHEGTCIKHRFGKCSIKMYDKHGIVLRIETTTNDVSFFKHHRKVEHRTGPTTRELAPVKKSIYSLIDLREILLRCNRCYIAHLSSPPGSAHAGACPNHARWTARRCSGCSKRRHRTGRRLTGRSHSLVVASRPTRAQVWSVSPVRTA